MESLISVIIPVYKVEQQINRCVESVVQQTWKHLEIILVDDASPDGCPRICDEWKLRDHRIKVIHQSHQGLSAARNAGISIAMGTYLAFVDSDDYIHPQMFEIMLQAIGSSDMCVSGYCRVSENKTEAKLYPSVCAGTYCGDEIINHLLWKDEVFWCSACNKLYRRELFSEIRYPVGKYYEDSFIIHKLLYQCRKVTVIIDELYYYVQRADSITEAKYHIGKMDACEAMLDRADFLISHGMGHDVLMVTLRNYFWSYVKGFWHLLIAGYDKRKAYCARLQTLRLEYATVYARMNKEECRLWERLFLWGMRWMMGCLCIPGMIRELLRR